MRSLCQLPSSLKREPDRLIMALAFTAPVLVL